MHVKINASGLRVGEDHHNAKLTDAEVDRLLALHDEGFGYKRLARMFEISRSEVRNICLGRRRCQTVAGHRRVHVPG